MVPLLVTFMESLGLVTLSAEACSENQFPFDALRSMDASSFYTMFIGDNYSFILFSFSFRGLVIILSAAGCSTYLRVDVGTFVIWGVSHRLAVGPHVEIFVIWGVLHRTAVGPALSHIY